MTRLEANREILRRLAEVVEAYPSWRFGQVIENCCTVVPVYEESSELLHRIFLWQEFWQPASTQTLDDHTKSNPTPTMKEAVMSEESRTFLKVFLFIAVVLPAVGVATWWAGKLAMWIGGWYGLAVLFVLFVATFVGAVEATQVSRRR